MRLAVIGIGLPLVLALNPFSGWVVWEPINKHLLTTMKEEAERVGLEGKNFYLLGSKFQVHFTSGVVSGWEPYDD